MVNIIAYYPGAGGNRYYNFLQNRSWQEPNKSYDEGVHDQLEEHRYLLSLKQYNKPGKFVLTHCLNLSRIKYFFPNSTVTVIKSVLKESLRREWLLLGHQRYLSQVAVSKSHNRVEHYNAIKDPTWPTVLSVRDISKLTAEILTEVNNNYEQILSTQLLNNDSVQDTLQKQYAEKINSCYNSIVWHLNYYTDYPVDIDAADTIIDIEDQNNNFSIQIKAEINRYSSDLYNDVWDSIHQRPLHN